MSPAFDCCGVSGIGAAVCSRSLSCLQFFLPTHVLAIILELYHGGATMASDARSDYIEGHLLVAADARLDLRPW